MRRGRGTRRHGRWRDACATLEVVHDLAKRREAERVDAARGRLCRVRGCHEDVAHAACPGEANARHRAANGPQLPIERELSEAKRGDVYAQLPARAEDSEGDRELESRFLPCGARPARD